MASNLSPDSPEPDKSAKGHSALVEVLKVLIPAISTVVVAYLSYLQIVQPRNIEIAATQTTVAMAQSATSLDAPVAITSAALTATVASSPAIPVTVADTMPEEESAEGATTQSMSTAMVTTAPALAAATTSALSTPTPPVSTTSSATEEMTTIITSDEDGAQVVEVLPDTLTFQGDRSLSLRSGEFIPFTNLLVIDVEQVRGGVVSLRLTFTDGSTAAATVVKDNDLLEGEAVYGTFQKNLFTLKQVRFPHEVQTAATSPPDQPNVTLTTQEGETAHVIADTLLFQQGRELYLASGEMIPFANLLQIEVGVVRGNTVPLSITFTDGTNLAATVGRDSDLVEGETLHGYFVKNMYALKLVEFPNEARFVRNPAPSSQPLVTITTEEGNVAQVIADTLLFQQDDELQLASGERISFTAIQSISVQEVRGADVFLEIVLTNGNTLAATVGRDSDVLEGETLHGYFLKNMYALKLVEFPN